MAGRRGARAAERPARPTTRTATCARATRRANGERQPGLRRDVRLHQRLRGAPAGHLRRGGRRRACSAPRASAGTCRVVCFSPRHDLTLGRMATDDDPARRRRLGRADDRARRGATAGSRCSRTAARRWAPRTRTRTARSGPGTALPGEARARGRVAARATCAATGRPLLLDYVDQERGGPRVVVETDDWLVVVPFWAAWPFETLLDPAAARAARLTDLDDAARDGLAVVLQRADRAATTGCSSGRSRTRWAGTRRRSATARPSHWQVHAHFYPPLLRANVRKFMVGYELLAEPQRDLTPEEAAERLRAVVPASALTRCSRRYDGAHRCTEGACGSGAAGSTTSRTRGWRTSRARSRSTPSWRSTTSRARSPTSAASAGPAC